MEINIINEQRIKLNEYWTEIVTDFTLSGLLQKEYALKNNLKFVLKSVANPLCKLWLKYTVGNISLIKIYIKLSKIS
jgi:hypothetical protein